jgi:prepilin-type processing-associated H-X9-DG protein
MDEQTTQFLVNLSHKWADLVLPLPVVFGVATYCSGVFLARTRLGGGSARRRSLGMVGRVLSCCLLAVSIAAAGASVLHLGCASLVGKSHRCLTNLKTLASGALMYAQDNDEHLPPAERWEKATAPYIPLSTMDPGNDPFRCPSSQSPSSYGMNEALDHSSLSDIDAPADTVFLFDAEAPFPSFAGSAEDVVVSRHGHAPNLAFADGHVKWANAYVLKKSVWVGNATLK